jgi:RecJ-like exonuclease
MLCPICHGQRLVMVDNVALPCPECGGHGEIHCCDGLQEQPDPAPRPPNEAGAAGNLRADDE